MSTRSITIRAAADEEKQIGPKIANAMNGPIRNNPFFGGLRKSENSSIAMKIRMLKASMNRLMISAFLACILAACQHQANAPETGRSAFAGLGGTSWRLVEVKPMDPATGPTRPDDPDKYTLTFNADGTLAARLDCNRGMGPWRNEIVEPSGGSLAMGPLAVTKALCPPPSIGEALASKLGAVRAFIIEDGRMHMALAANGGILVWEPVASPQ